MNHAVFRDNSRPWLPAVDRVERRLFLQQFRGAAGIVNAAETGLRKDLAGGLFADLARLETADRVADKMGRNEPVTAHRRELPDVGLRQAVRPAVDAQREIDHVGIDADFCGDFPDAIDVSADHHRDPLVRLLDPFQRLLQFLPAVENGIDARSVELDRVDRQHIPAVVNAVGVRPLDDGALRGISRRCAARYLAAARLCHDVDGARLVDQFGQMADLRRASFVIEPLRWIDEQDIIPLQRIRTAFSVQAVRHPLILTPRPVPSPC